MREGDTWCLCKKKNFPSLSNIKNGFHVAVRLSVRDYRLRQNVERKKEAQ